MTHFIDAHPEIPVLLGFPENGEPNCKTWKVWCPHCRVWHIHGAMEGFRTPHCTTGPWAKGWLNYYIMPMERALVDKLKTRISEYTRRNPGNSLRFSILQRDKFTCQYCGRKAPEVVLHVDHRISVKNGGPTTPENLISSCRECNLGKRARNA